MNYALYINYLIGVTSFLSVVSFASTASPKCHGKRLGEVCDYRRTCLDANAKCVGQIKQDSSFAGKENLFQYKCECERFFEEIDGKCKFSLKIFIVPGAVISFLILVAILLIFFVKRKVQFIDLPLLSEEGAFEKIVVL